MQKLVSEIKNPKITIVTVVYNGALNLERTITSVLNQSYKNIEYVIIDGGSNDGTLEIISKYQDKIDYWETGSDEGIYDAMNKGLSNSTGNWINFMNSGDVFFKNDTIESIFSEDWLATKIIYGSVEIIYEDFKRIQLPGPPKSLWKGMQFSHQSSFIDVEYHKSNLYRKENKIAADLGFFHNAYSQNKKFSRTNKIVSSVINGGVSDSHRVQTILDSCNTVCNGKFFPITRLYYCWKIFDCISRQIIKSLLPNSIVKKFILLKK